MHEPLYGVSFSLKQCRNFSLDWREALTALIDDLGVKRFRLMSYWNEHETEQGKYDFSALDEQIDLIAKSGGVIALCLGARQPRWPENHWPDWAWNLPKKERDESLLRYIQVVVERYKNQTAITSYQLENEALLKNFGKKGDFDKNRLLTEFYWVKQIDPMTPVIMTTSTSWGIPLRQPVGDMVGFSYYQIVYNQGKYSRSFHRPWLDRWRARLIKVIHRAPSFIHELQAEPWGPKNIWEMSHEEQAKSMSLDQLKKNISQAQKTKLYPIDLWGAEWWYWRKAVHHDTTIWQEVKPLFNT